MEIKIDTQKDSKEEIMKVIKFLQGLVEDSSACEYRPPEGVFGNFMDSPKVEIVDTKAAEPKAKPMHGIRDLETY